MSGKKYRTSEHKASKHIKSAQEQEELNSIINEAENSVFSLIKTRVLSLSTKQAFAALKFKDSSTEDLAERFGRMLATASDWEGRPNKALAGG